MTNNDNIKILLKNISNQGFTIKKTKNGYKVIHDNSQKSYSLHLFSKNYHPIKRWLKYNFNIILI